MAVKKGKSRNYSPASPASGALDEFRDRFASLEAHMHEVQVELEELQTLTTKLLDVGVAISSEIDLYSLLTRIIEEAKGLLKADKGTLYLVDRDKNELYFHVTDADILKEIRMKIDHSSIAGYVAHTSDSLNIKDVYKIGKREPYKFNKNIDIKTGYRTQSVLTVPMLNHEGDVTGAVQLINKIRDGKVIPFSQRDQRILLSLASQAAVAIENAQLYKEIADLFSAFVRYSASAIDERDPATAGHSRRVAMYAVATARCMKCFSEDEIREIEYAAWLHDVGKIGVREHILIKENKLYTEEMAKIRERFETIKIAAKIKSVERHEDELLKTAIAEIDADLAFIERINRPGFMSQEDIDRIDATARKTFEDAHCAAHPYLSAKEAETLKIRRGNLTEEEREDMNAHVLSSHKILSQIPFTRRLRHVPEFASVHHERLDGSGYPHGLKTAQIPLQGKILALVDVYDALTAQDRPYKPAIPVEKSLKILDEEVKIGHMDKKVFDVFVKNKIYDIEDPGDTAQKIVIKLT
jgi:HD-GYP domain-containing protein (c-di-GMP phosphodiesterase class II)